MINAELLTIRDLNESDLPRVLNYWFDSPPGFIESIGVDFAKMPTRSEMEKNLTEKFRANQSRGVSKLNAVAIVYDGEPIGMHSIHPLIEGDYGIFHAHIWKPELRRQGLGQFTYPMACNLFIERFDLKRILFKTPLQNTGAIRAKEKLNIRCIGEETINFGIIRDETRAKVFELTREEARALAERVLGGSMS